MTGHGSKAHTKIECWHEKYCENILGGTDKAGNIMTFVILIMVYNYFLHFRTNRFLYRNLHVVAFTAASTRSPSPEQHPAERRKEEDREYGHL